MDGMSGAGVRAINRTRGTTLVFKEFGTSVVFVPTVIGRDEIALEVKPEVSQPDFAIGVNLFGFTVPGFITRRAQTFVRLKNNQTLIIAGLLLRTRTSRLTKPRTWAIFRISGTSSKGQPTRISGAIW
jgi:pilus assembly protein CpaC